MLDNDTHIFKGMRQDADIAKQPAEYLWEAHNIRLTTRDGNTLLAITNEKSTDKIIFRDNASIEGYYLGHCVIGDYLILFTNKETIDNSQITNTGYIYQITKENDEFVLSLLYSNTNLNFDREHPIETIGYIENENIVKVYWVDGKNQPRLINIKQSYDSNRLNCPFDFIQELVLNEEVKIYKDYGGGGLFPAGVIQYCFTYFNLYAQESNIVWISPIYYISHKDRAGSPDKRVDNIFTIEISNIDTNYDGIRIYSIIRTSLDATPVCKRVAELLKPNSVPNTHKYKYIDNNLNGEIVDPEYLQTIGGIPIIAGCIGTKDNTLFLGDIKYNKKQPTIVEGTKIFEIIKETAYLYDEKGTNDYFSYLHTVDTDSYDASTHYTYNLKNATGFKVNEQYRFGLQFQDKYGVWTDPIFINDKIIVDNNNLNRPSLNNNNLLSYPCVRLSLLNFRIMNNTEDITNDFVKVRGVVCYPKLAEQRVVTQGVLNPTMFLDVSREKDLSFWQPSWFYRPFNKHWFRYSKWTDNIIPIDANCGDYYNYADDDIQYGALLQFRHHEPLMNVIYSGRGGEIEGYNPFYGIDTDYKEDHNGGITYDAVYSLNTPYNKSYIDGNYENAYVKGKLNYDVDDQKIIKNHYYIDQQMLTLDSPEVNFDTDFYYKNYDHTTISLIGKAQYNKYAGAILIQTDTNSSYTNGGLKYRNKSNFVVNPDGRCLCSLPCYEDHLIDDFRDLTYKPYGSPVYWVIYPWQSEGNISNAPNKDGYNFNKLNKKIFSNLKYFNTLYTNIDSSEQNPVINTIKYFNGEDVSGLQFKFEGKNEIYTGWVDDIYQYSEAEYGKTFVLGDSAFQEGASIKSEVITNIPVYYYKTQDENNNDIYIKITKSTCPYDTNAYINYGVSLVHYNESIIENENRDAVGKYKTKVFNIFSILEANNYPGNITIYPLLQGVDKDNTPNTLITIDSSASNYMNNYIDVNNPRQAEYFTDFVDLTTFNYDNYGKHFDTLDSVGLKQVYDGSILNTVIKDDFFNILWLEEDASRKTDIINNNEKNLILSKLLQRAQRPLIPDSKDGMYPYIEHTQKLLPSLFENFNRVGILKDYERYSDIYNFRTRIGDYSYNKDIFNSKSFLTFHYQKGYKGWDWGYERSDNPTMYGQPSIGNSNAVMGRIFCTDLNNTDHYITFRGRQEVGDYDKEITTLVRSTRIKYKTSKHLAVLLNNPLEWPHNQYFMNEPAYLYIAEIIKDVVNPFGGNSSYSLLQNEWVPAGDPVKLTDCINNNTFTYTYNHGDTWYQRYDCLHTYPYTEEDTNQVIEIGSFLLETRYNIDGRYDENRGLTDNSYVNENNFNMVNPVYSQKDNFFTYKIKPSIFYKTNSLPHIITWTKEKHSAENVDQWTNITMVSQLELDGDKGHVEAIKKLNDLLYAFQEKGIAQILYNSRVQIPTSDNIPIEISNSMKVDGKKYLISDVGSVNKFAIANNDNFLYFIDNNTKGLFSLTSEGIKNLSETNSFGDWFRQIDYSRWQPGWKGSKLSFDLLYRDLYISNENECLDYNEMLGGFISFMSYEKTSSVLNFKDKVLAFKDIDNTCTLHEMFSNKGYNHFFGEYKSFDITFVSNKGSNDDKIFTNIDIRGDFYEPDNNTVEKEFIIGNERLALDKLFDYIKVWDEHQSSIEKPLIFDRTLISNLKKKFRIWRLDIPRRFDPETQKETMDRIRNTWVKIKLGTNGKNRNEKAVIHDINVQFF